MPSVKLLITITIIIYIICLSVISTSLSLQILRTHLSIACTYETNHIGLLVLVTSPNE